MAMQINLGPVVETGTPYGSIIESEARNTDNVQWGKGGGTEPSDVSGVRRDLRFDESDTHN
jgi:hypothetical protein